MRKIIVASFIFIALCFTIWLFFAKKENKIHHLKLIGDSQFLIDYSVHTNRIVYAGVLFSGDSMEVKVFDENERQLCKGFVNCNFVSDSMLLAFDKKSRPYLINKETGFSKKINLNYDFQKHNLINDIKITRYKNRMTLVCNAGSSLISFDLESSNLSIEIPSLVLVDGVGEIVSFDVFNDKLLVCRQKGCKTGNCIYQYLLINPEDNSQKEVFHLSQLESDTYSPVVAFVDEQKFVTNYYEGKSHVIVKFFDNDKVFDNYDIDELKVISVDASKKYIYLTVLDETVRNNNEAKNPLEKLFVGMSVVELDLN